MNMNDTPKTDALRLKFEGSPVATYIGELWDFARQIERESAELRKLLKDSSGELEAWLTTVRPDIAAISTTPPLILRINAVLAKPRS
jgi:hypothetical protein